MHGSVGADDGTISQAYEQSAIIGLSIPQRSDADGLGAQLPAFKCKIVQRLLRSGRALKSIAPSSQEALFTVLCMT